MLILLFKCDVYQLPSPALYLLHPHSGVSLKTHCQVFTQHSTVYLLQPDQNFLIKVKVEDLEGLLAQKHGMIVLKVKVEDLEGLLTQKHGMIVMKVKVEDLEGLLTQKHSMILMKVKVEDLEDLGGSSNIQEYLLLLC